MTDADLDPPTGDVDSAETQAVRALFRRRPLVPLAERPVEGGANVRSLPAPVESGGDYVGAKAVLQERMITELQQRGVLGEDEETLTRAVEEWVARVLETEDLPMNDTEREHLAEELVEEALGLGPLGVLMADPAVTDILVNGYDNVYVERFGRLERTDIRFSGEEHVRRMIERLAMRVGRRIDQSSPMVDLRLPDGSRVNATLPPVSIDGPTISIRRFGRNRLRSSDVLKLRMIDPRMWSTLRYAVAGSRNILISGGTGAGKSTLLGILAEAIPADERIVTIEDTAELVLDQEHVVRLETRPPNAEGQGRITARELLVNTLRMRPSRIIVGEVRSGEALDMLQAMNTGHEGGLTTIHANSSRDALSRLETMVLMAGADLPSRAIREQMTAALDLVVHVRRFTDGIRRVSSISEITGMESGTPLLQDIFRFETTGHAGGRVQGDFIATGIVPRFVEELRRTGTTVPLDLFAQAAPAEQGGERRSAERGAGRRATDRRGPTL
ncbi:MAG: CpaF family protein [Planctomycetota bacterium]